MQTENLKDLPKLEWPTTYGSFSGSTTRPYAVDAFPLGLKVRDTGYGTLEFALRSDVFDSEGNLFAKTSANTVKKFATAEGFWDLANCILTDEIVSNLIYSNGTVFAALKSGLLAKIDCQKMTADYLDLKAVLSTAFAVSEIVPPKNLLIADNSLVFVVFDKLVKLDLNTNAVKYVIFKDAQPTETFVLGDDAIYIVNKQCEIHKILVSAIDNTKFETNYENTVSFYRQGYELPKALVFAEGNLHFRLVGMDEDDKKMKYVTLENFASKKMYNASIGSCLARYIVPSVVDGKVYVSASSYYINNSTEKGTLLSDSGANKTCNFTCQRSPAGCDSKLVPPIIFYDDENSGQIGHDLYPGQIAFSNQRVSMFQILMVQKQPKLFVITAVYKDYFAARSNDGNVYILDRETHTEKVV